MRKISHNSSPTELLPRLLDVCGSADNDVKRTILSGRSLAAKLDVKSFYRKMKAGKKHSELAWLRDTQSELTPECYSTYS